MMNAARSLKRLKQFHFCLRSAISVCKRLYFDSFPSQVLVTCITGSVSDNLALLAAYQIWREFSAALSLVAATYTVHAAFLRD